MSFNKQSITDMLKNPPQIDADFDKQIGLRMDNSVGSHNQSLDQSHGINPVQVNAKSIDPELLSR